MAAKKPSNTVPKAPRVLTCEISGRTFTYSGRGRPGKYHPDVRKELAAKTRKDNRAAKKASFGGSVATAA